MSRTPSQLAVLTVAFACALALAACGSNAPVLQYVTVSPVSGTAQAIAGTCGGDTVNFTASAYYSDGSIKDGTSLVTWSSSNTQVATISAGGVATAVGQGKAAITATASGTPGATSDLTVTAANATSLSITPGSTAIPLGNPTAPGTQQYNFSAILGSGATEDLTTTATWASSNDAVATIGANTGLATAVSSGTTHISATIYCVTVPPTTSPNVLTVKPAKAGISLQITPATSTASVGTTVQYTAAILNSDSSTSPLPVGTVLAWTSSSSSATINGTTGLAQAVSAGTPTITATATAPASINGLTGTSGVLTVLPAAARFAYIANITGNGGSGSITSYTVNPTSTSAPLTLLANTPAESPQQVLLHPSGDLLYYIDSNGALHFDFINSVSGALTETSQAFQASNAPPGSTYVGAIDPTGRYIYVVTKETSVISGLQITHTQPSGGTNDGTLTPIPGMTAYTDATLKGPTWIMTDNTGEFAYVVNSLGNTVSQYAIQSNGSLKPLATPTTPTGSSPRFGTTDTNGHLFVANRGSSGGTGPNGPSVSVYIISPPSASNPGELTAIGTAPTPINGATETINVAVNPNGFLYVLDFGNGTTAGQVFAYGLSASSGVIGTVIGTAAPTGIAPTGIAVDPTGVLLAVDNSNDGDVSTYNIGTNGGVTPTSPATTPSDTNTKFITFYTAASGQ